MKMSSLQLVALCDCVMPSSFMFSGFSRFFGEENWSNLREEEIRDLCHHFNLFYEGGELPSHFPQESLETIVC